MAWSISDLFPTWGDSGEKPSSNFQYDGGDQVNEKHIDYLWDSVGTLEDETRAALSDIDGDGDGIVDEADYANDADASTYKGNDIDPDGDGVVDQAGDADTVDGTHAGDLGPTFSDGTVECHIIETIRFGAEGTSTTNTSYTTISASDIAFPPGIYSDVDGNLYVRVFAHLYHNGAGTTYLRMYRQNAASAVSGSEVTVSGDGWGFASSDWIDFSGESLDSFHLQMKTSDGAEGRYNSVVLQFGVPT